MRPGTSSPYEDHDGLSLDDFLPAPVGIEWRESPSELRATGVIPRPGHGREKLRRIELAVMLIGLGGSFEASQQCPLFGLWPRRGVTSLGSFAARD